MSNDNEQPNNSFPHSSFPVLRELTDEEMSGKKLADNQWLGAEAGL